MTIQFKYVMLMVKDIPAAVKFYSEGLGLTVKTSTPGWAELEADGTTIAFHAARGEPEVGNSPILSFNVDDIHRFVSTLEAMGAKLEGDIREPSFGKVAALRSPDGHLLSLLQPAPVAEATS